MSEWNNIISREQFQNKYKIHYTTLNNWKKLGLKVYGKGRKEFIDLNEFKEWSQKEVVI